MSPKQIVKDIITMTVATLIIATAVYFFLMPAHVAICSVSGLAIVLAQITPLSVSTLTMIMNVVLLIIGFILCGHAFGAKTVYTSILLPIFLGMYEHLLPNFKSLNGSQAIDVVCFCLIISLGQSILFNMNASSGGLDIVAMILHKYFKLPLGTAMSGAGVVIAFSAILAYDTKTVILSLVGTYLNGLVLDHFLFNRNLKRRVCIVSPKLEEIRQFILHDLKSGATLYQAIGAYNLEKRDEIITIVDKIEYQKLMTFIKETDPDAFVTVYNVNEIQYRPKTFA
ncbi:MAG: YitT family protein [Lachnospiraceae bacterium]|nr:YitT family protein [Lachnospiraceae bacterium]